MSGVNTPDECEDEPPLWKLPCICTENYFSHSRLLITKPETAAGHAPCGSPCTWHRIIENKGHTHANTHANTRGLDTLHGSYHPTPSPRRQVTRTRRRSLSPRQAPPSFTAFALNEPSSSPTGWPLCTVLPLSFFLVQGEQPFENKVKKRCWQPT